MFSSELFSDSTVDKHNSEFRRSSFPLSIWFQPVKFQHSDSIFKATMETRLKAKVFKDVVNSVAEPREWVLEITWLLHTNAVYFIISDECKRNHRDLADQWTKTFSQDWEQQNNSSGEEEERGTSPAHVVFRIFQEKLRHRFQCHGNSRKRSFGASFKTEKNRTNLISILLDVLQLI